MLLGECLVALIIILLIIAGLANIFEAVLDLDKGEGYGLSSLIILVTLLLIYIVLK